MRKDKQLIEKYMTRELVPRRKITNASRQKKRHLTGNQRYVD